MVYCVQCGTALPDGTQFCTKCGAQILQSGTAGFSSQTPQSISTEPQESITPATAYLMKWETGTGLHLMKDRSVSDASGNVLFVVHKKSNWKMDYEVLDANGERKGSFNIKALGPHHTTEVQDSTGIVTSYVKRKLVTFLAPEWWVEDAQQQKISDIKGNFGNFEYTVFSNEGKAQATIDRNFASFSNLVRGAYAIRLADPAFDKVLLFALCIAVEETGRR